MFILIFKFPLQLFDIDWTVVVKKKLYSFKLRTLSITTSHWRYLSIFGYDSVMRRAQYVHSRRLASRSHENDPQPRDSSDILNIQLHGACFTKAIWHCRKFVWPIGIQASNESFTVIRDHFVYASSQWETTFQCNVVSHKHIIGDSVAEWQRSQDCPVVDNGNSQPDKIFYKHIYWFEVVSCFLSCIQSMIIWYFFLIK